MLSITTDSGHPHGASFFDRVLGLRGNSTTTVVDSHTVTRVSTQLHHEFNLGETLRNTAIGGAIGAALGGAALLGKFALPLLGGVKNLAGVVRFGTLGAGIGLATAVLPVIAPSLNEHPVLKAALTGASVGATAGMFLPILSPVGGALIGAAIGAGVALFSNRDNNRYGWSNGTTCPPGVVGSPNGTPYGFNGTPYGYRKPGLLARIFGTSSYGPMANPAYAGMNYLQPGYSQYGASVGGSPTAYASPYGYGSPYGQQLGMSAPAPQAGMAMQPAMLAPAALPVPVRAAAKAAKAKATVVPKSKAAKKAAAKKAARKAAAKAAARQAAAAQAAQVGMPAATPLTNAAQGAAMTGMAGLTNPASFLSPSMAGMMPFSGGSPFTAGQQFMASTPQMLAGMPGAAGAVPVLTGPIGAPIVG